MSRILRTAALAGVLGLAPGSAAPPQAPAVPAQGRLTDAQAAELARGALTAQDPASMREALVRLRNHAFRSSSAPEREVVLYARGMLEARLGNLAGAVVPLRMLERQWPSSPYTAEAQVVMAESAVALKHYPEAERRLHRALEADIPSERKRRAQELLLWALVAQDRPLEGLPIVQGLLPLAGDARPSERGLAAMAEVLCAGGEREQAEGVRRSLATLYPASALLPRVDLAYARLLGKAGEATASAEVLRKLLSDHPRAPEADEARLALADLLTNGRLPAGKDLPSAQSLLDEIRKGGRGLPKGRAQLVELRLLVTKSLWEDALNLWGDLDPAVRATDPEFTTLWQTAWRSWVDERLAKGFAGELLTRLKPGTFRALEPRSRRGVVELLAAQGLLGTVPTLLSEAPPKERGDLRKAALAKADPQGQPEAMLRMLPARGGTRGDLLLRAEALAALGRWSQLRADLPGLSAGAERIRLLTAYLQRPAEPGEGTGPRLKEAEGWLSRAREKGQDLEPLAILVADLRFQAGDVKGALALYPPRAESPAQRGWVALMRAQALLKLGQSDAARTVIREARDEQGFKGQRDALARSLGSY